MEIIFNSPLTILLQFVILVIDSTDRERLSVTREELYKMLNHEELVNAAVLIYANKQDVKDCMSAAEISKQLDLTSIKNQQWHIQSCCALTGEGYLFYSYIYFNILFPRSVLLKLKTTLIVLIIKKKR